MTSDVSSVRSKRPGLDRDRALRCAPYAVALAALAFLLWCTLTDIARPGLQYDEALFVNAALGGDYIGGTFVSSSFHGVPTMVMPYSGALKSWLYWPLLQLFDGSVTLIRLPMVALLVATIGVAFAMGRRLFGLWPAALLVVLLATDPVYMTMAKADWGPVAISGFMRIAVLAAYFAWLRTESARYLWLLAAAIVLGAFNKIDFLAFVAAFGIAVLAVHAPDVWRRARRRPVGFSLPVVALAVALVVVYWKIWVPARDYPAPKSDSGLLSGRLPELWRLVRVTFDGTSIHPYMTLQPAPHRTAIAALIVVTTLLAAGVAAWWVSQSVRHRSLAGDGGRLAEAARTTAFLLVVFVVMFVALAATPEAIGPHHAALLWPLPALLAVSLVAFAARLDAGRVRVVATTGLAVAAGLFAISQVRVADDYRSAFASDASWSSYWTTEIYPVVTTADRYAPGLDAIATGDWGIGNQLLALGHDDLRTRLDDAWGIFAGGDQAAIDRFAEGLRGRRTAIALHVRGNEIMPQTTERVEAMIARLRPARGTEVLWRGSRLELLVVDDRP